MNNNDTWLELSCERSVHSDAPSLIYVNIGNISVIDKTFRTIVMKDGSYWTLARGSMNVLIETLNIEPIKP
jgi:hypothetical protein